MRESLKTELVGKQVLFTPPLDEWTQEQAAKVREATGQVDRTPESKAGWRKAYRDAAPRVPARIVSVYLVDGSPWYTLAFEDGSLRDVSGGQVRLDVGITHEDRGIHHDVQTCIDCRAKERGTPVGLVVRHRGERIVQGTILVRAEDGTFVVDVHNPNGPDTTERWRREDVEVVIE